MWSTSAEPTTNAREFTGKCFLNPQNRQQMPGKFTGKCFTTPVFRHARSNSTARMSQNKQNETLTQYAICTNVRKQPNRDNNAVTHLH